MKVLYLIIIIGIILVIIPLSGIILTSDGTYDHQPVDYIVIPGAKVNNQGPEPTLKARLDQALILALDNPNAKIVVSGGQGIDEPTTEATAMEKYLVDYGIDKDRIIKEDKATSTYENLLYVKNLNVIDDNDSVVVISSDFHLFRINFLLKRLDLEFMVAPSHNDFKLKSVLREIMAIYKSYILDRGDR